MIRVIQLMPVLVGLAAASPALFAQTKARVVVPAERIFPMATTLGAVTASPATISFAATDPDLGPFTGSSSATVSWTTSGGAAGSTWTLKVQAAAATFASCATVPTSAVTAMCTGVAGGTGGACTGGSGFALSTAGQQVASGKEATGIGKSYSVTINFTLADSWSYIAKSSCTLSLTYTVTAP